jgi:uncharacterized protein (DUF2237 family)
MLMPSTSARGTPRGRRCLSAARWKEALDAGVAPRVVFRATHQGALIATASATSSTYTGCNFTSPVPNSGKTGITRDNAAS